MSSFNEIANTKFVKYQYKIIDNINDSNNVLFKFILRILNIYNRIF